VVARRLMARGMPRAQEWMTRTASSENRVSLRPAWARWARRYPSASAAVTAGEGMTQRSWTLWSRAAMSPTRRRLLRVGWPMSRTVSGEPESRLWFVIMRTASSWSPVRLRGRRVVLVGRGLGVGVPADDLRDRPADLPALPVDGQLRHVERVEHALHLPARQERVDGVHVPLDGDGGRLADLPDHAPGERLLQQRGVRQRRLAAGRQPGGRRLAGLGVRPGVVDRAQPRGEQPVQLLQAGGRVPGRGPAVGVAGDLDQELLLDHPEHAF